jgi:hypothetical protein
LISRVTGLREVGVMTYPQQPLRANPTGWPGRILFAAAMLVIAGVLAVIEGLCGTIYALVVPRREMNAAA